MKDRTCILVTHHVRLCLPVAEMAIKMDSGNAQIEDIEEADLLDLTDDAAEESGDTDADLLSSKAPTTGINTPMNATLITKEHRETVSSCA